MKASIEEARREAVRTAILKSARTIIEEEGVKKVSIRRLAQEIGYSPGSIYQYFKDKNAIVSSVIGSGYKALMRKVMSEDMEGYAPEERIRRRFMAYAKEVLAMPYYYRNVMFTDDAAIVNRTAVLNGDSISERPAFKELIEALEEGKKTGCFTHGDSVLYAQLVWTSVFGVLSRAIIEGVDEARVLSFVNHSLRLSLEGMKKIGV